MFGFKTAVSLLIKVFVLLFDMNDNLIKVNSIKKVNSFKGLFGSKSAASLLIKVFVLKRYSCIFWPQQLKNRGVAFWSQNLRPRNLSRLIGYPTRYLSKLNDNYHTQGTQWVENNSGLMVSLHSKVIQILDKENLYWVDQNIQNFIVLYYTALVSS